MTENMKHNELLQLQKLMKDEDSKVKKEILTLKNIKELFEKKLTELQLDEVRLRQAVQDLEEVYDDEGEEENVADEN